MTKEELWLTAQELYLSSVIWRQINSLVFHWEVVMHGHVFTIRVNDFPEDPLFTLFIDGKAVMNLEDWPDLWNPVPNPSSRKPTKGGSGLGKPNHTTPPNQEIPPNEERSTLDEIARILHRWEPGTQNAYVPSQLPAMVRNLMEGRKELREPTKARPRHLRPLPPTS